MAKKRRGHVSVCPAAFAAIRAEARRRGVSLAQVVEDMIRRYTPAIAEAVVS